jgi:SAM-dependent methyltransferase
VNAGLKCRFCSASLEQTFVDLGMSPPCQRHIGRHELGDLERFYPLHAFVCSRCFLVQLGEFVTPEEIFSDYAYFSSFASSWLKHCEDYAAQMTERFHLGAGSRVFEVASNDGYLLQYFLKQGIRVLGVEPAANVAKVAVAKGVPTIVEFLGSQTSRRIVAEYGRADLVVGNNVLAHVPDLNDFIAGLGHLLSPSGVLTMEFPHLLRLIASNQFDTIYHEHFSYFSFTTVEQIFAAHGIVLFDVEELATHGGSLRIYGRHRDDAGKAIGPNVAALKDREEKWGVRRLAAYAGFDEQVKAVKRGILQFLIGAKNEGKTIVGYGAPGKGNTLLNYCGIRTDFLDFTVDRNPVKQGNFTPGTHIPILAPDRIKEARPDYLFILPWNLKDEIMEENAYIRDWGGKFVVPIPHIRVYP